MPVQSIESVQETSKQVKSARPSSLPKTDVRYWQAVLFHPSYTREGMTHQLADWAVKIQHRGRRETFSLSTPNKAAAAARAKDIYLSLQSAGWADTLAKYKPGMNAKLADATMATVEEFIAAAIATASARQNTLEGYAKAFRKIVADIHGIDGGKAKFDYVNGGREKWLRQVNAVSLATITPESIQQWKLSFIRAAGTSPLRQREAKNSANAFLRNARSLFSPKLLKFIQVNLPAILPFAGVQFEPRSSTRYRSVVDAVALVKAASTELAEHHPEQFKIFLLGIMAGLRRREIDLLEWASLDFERGLIRIIATEHFQPKSEDSAGDVEVDAELLEIFRAARGKATGPFVIESKNPPRPKATYRHYRCQRDFEALAVWLKSKGVPSKNPLHAMRKEFGSLLCERGGIFEASRALRHADIRTTSAHYLDRKRRVTVGLGGLLVRDES